MSRIIGKINHDFRFKIGQIIKNEFKDVLILDTKIKTFIGKDNIKRNYKYYKIQCNKCEQIRWIEEHYLLSNIKTSACCNKVHKAKLGVNTIFDTDPWMIQYVGEEIAKNYTRCSPKRIHPTCPDCGRISGKTLNIYNIYTHKGISCSCSDGIKYPNKFMFNLLEQLKIDFINEYSPEWIKSRKYDFYIPSLNIIVEMDGGLGHGKKKHGKSQLTVEESKVIDDYKDEQARLHGIEVIRIDCDYKDITKRFELIKKNILKSSLSEKFDLNIINWLKVEEFALSNLVKIACELKYNNPDLTTGQIAKIMGNYTKSTIRVWLIKGNDLGWCTYDSEKERHMSGKVSASAKFKPTICLNNGLIFKSVKECSEKSLDLLGTYIHKTCIGEVCRGKRTQTKGFSFKYIKDLTSEEYIKYDIENKLKII